MACGVGVRGKVYCLGLPEVRRESQRRVHDEDGTRGWRSALPHYETHSEDYNNKIGEVPQVEEEEAGEEEEEKEEAWERDRRRCGR